MIGGGYKEGTTQTNSGSGVFHAPSQRGGTIESLKGQKEENTKTHTQHGAKSISLSGTKRHQKAVT